MSLHQGYLVVLGLVFALALAVTILSLIAHRRALGTPRVAFFAPTGDVQFVWAAIPIAILFAVGYALIDTPDNRRAPAPKVAVAFAALPPVVTARPAAPARGQRPPSGTDAPGPR